MTADEILKRDFASFADVIRVHAENRPRHRALVQDGRSLDYAALDERMDRIAAALQRDGIQPTETVAICAGTSIEYAAVYLGALRAGAAVAPLSTSASPESLRAMAEDAGAKIVFDDARLAALDSWMAPPGTKPAPVDVQPGGPFNIIYSSGTTGTPKGIVQPHVMRWRHIQRGVRNEFGPDAITLLSTPLYSNTTLVAFFPTLGLGGTVVLMAKFDVRRFLELSQEHRVTHAALVPVQYQRIMAFPEFDRYDLSSYRMKTSTSSPFPAALKKDVLRRWPGKLVDVYGLTEGGGTFILDCHLHPDKLHTVGKPAPGHDIRLLDDQGREAPPGQAGEVVGHSPSMMTGYRNQPELTREAEWFDATGKRFLRTGDVGRFDEDGFLVLVDRKKDMIISGGFNVYPSDLEAVLRQHPAVAEASVVGVPSIRWGETPVAFVVAKEGRATKDKDILEWANARLGKTQRLAGVEIVDALPRSPIGKVLKRELRNAWRKPLPGEELA